MLSAGYQSVKIICAAIFVQNVPKDASSLRKINTGLRMNFQLSDVSINLKQISVQLRELLKATLYEISRSAFLLSPARN